jgi:hypothetical protein
MKGYLLSDQPFKPGEEVFIECVSEESPFMVIFEDDTDTGYFYALEVTDPEKGEHRILDAVHIYNVEETADQEKPWNLKIIWSKDWLRCALVINGNCQAVFDFENQGGYNLNEFPPPNEFWTKGERKLTNEMIADFFK